VPDTARHLDLYSQVDIALDPFPYHGTTTTCEAIWMGVPVVTLAGDRHRARVGVSLLSAVGRQDLIARDEAEYRRIALELAGDHARRDALRRSLRGSMAASALCDGEGYAAAFAGAVRQMWRAWCRGG
jgi:protein O-GlcNAc transferase